MSMTVQQLRDALKNVPGDALVVMGADSEGNNYSPLADVALGRYDAETTWSGVFYEDTYIGNDAYAQPSKQAVVGLLMEPTN